MDYRDTFVSQQDAERMARREQAKAMRAMFRNMRIWLSRRFVGGFARPGAAH